jgi:hypothetical protein
MLRWLRAQSLFKPTSPHLVFLSPGGIGFNGIAELNHGGNGVGHGEGTMIAFLATEVRFQGR